MITIITPKEKLLERLEKETIKLPNGCWLWTGICSRSGYGIIQAENQPIRVHRLSAYIHWNFDLNSQIMILHKIICLHRNCWWSEHLYEGTQRENIVDSIFSGTHSSVINKQKTHCPNGHEYNEENTYIRSNGRRVCRMCNKLKKREAQNDRNNS